VESERKTLVQLENQKQVKEEEIRHSEETLENLRAELATLQEAFEEKTKKVDSVKKTANKSMKSLEAGVKEISAWVSNHCHPLGHF